MLVMKISRRQFGIRSLFAIVLLSALGIWGWIWWFDRDYQKVFHIDSPKHGKATIYAKYDSTTDRLYLRIKTAPRTYHEQIETFYLEPYEYGEIKFDSVVDVASGTIVIYDLNNQHFVMMFEPGGTYWHPGVHVGWWRGYWADRYQDIRKRHPKLPYRTFPTERPIAADTE